MKEAAHEERIEELRSLPAVSALLARRDVAQMIEEHGHHAVVQALRGAIAHAREELRGGRAATLSERDIRERLRAVTAGRLRPVINATGVLVHTNLGRVPLARRALEAVERIASGYSTLEYDAQAGKRGHRHTHVVDLLRALTGADDALVVNNNAAAMLLALTACAHGREAIVSRGELVEIGGGFRIPDVVRQSGAALIEIGTTNRTHRADYESAIGERTALVLKVHRSNFEMIGFTAEVAVPELAELAHARGVVLAYDAGSGCMPPIAPLVGELAIVDHVRAGADIVTFSGDKLLGGPQAGIIVGRRDLVEAMRRAPLYRALRPDKMTLAALNATLVLWRDSPDELPLVRMLREPPSELEARCHRLRERLSASRADIAVVASIGRIGGGAAPTIELESRALRIRAAGADADALAARLRTGEPHVVARIEDGAVLVDLRSVPPEHDAALGEALTDALD